MSSLASGLRFDPQRIDDALRAVGNWLQRHRGAVRISQASVFTTYMALIILPVFVPFPERTAHIWNNITLFAQFAFWGIWWPGVLLSTMLVGRIWCGLMCPEGSLTEFASGRGLNLPVPTIFKWKGWPFLAFCTTTLYGQMVSVTYGYAMPVLIILGGSTLAAGTIGFLFDRNKRTWCRFLCPVSGVFTLLAKLAPVHFRTDREAWRTYRQATGIPAPAVNCATVVPIGAMRGSAGCHMCGRCNGYRDAIVLARRSPNHEIVHVAGTDPKPWETALLVFGLLGLACGAFHWTVSDGFIAIKQTIAEWAIDTGRMWLVEPVAPWWILTNYPDQNDVMVPADGFALVFYVFGVAAGVALALCAALAAATRALGPWSTNRFHHLAQSLIPIAACGVLLGLSAMTITLLHAEGIDLPFVAEGRALLLAGAAIWCIVLAWQIGGVYSPSPVRRTAAAAATSIAVTIGLASWLSLFFAG